ncbi:MAG: 1-acyl-sn-glycerol-3-phosphate acyltransferase [Bacteroidia bacterium]
MKRKLHIIYYNTLKFLIAFGLRMFYRKHDIEGYHENVPKGKAVIFAGNHQNALIDALNIVCTTPSDRQPSFMTRSDIFIPSVKPILTSFKMLPIYRQQDGGDPVKQNEEIFATCVRRLRRNEALIIFPEGNHNRQRRLRPLKKGAARIAFLAEEDSDFTLGTQIVPVGLNYSKHRNFRGDLFVKYGKPVNTEDFHEAFKANPQRTLIKVTQAISDSMKDCILHIADKDNYDAIETLRMIYEVPMTQKQGLNPRRQGDIFATGKKLIAAIEAKITENDPQWPEIAKIAGEYSESLKNHRWRDHVVAGGPYNLAGLLLYALSLILLFPIYLWGLINNYIPYKIPDYLALKLFRDDHFHSSIRAAVALIMFPFFYSLQTAIVWALTDWKWAAAYLIALPLTGNFAYTYSVWVKKWYSRWKFSSLFRKNDLQVKDLVTKRKTLANYLDSITSHVREIASH